MRNMLLLLYASSGRFRPIGAISATPLPPPFLPDEGHDLGGKALQALDAGACRLAAEVEDQLVHADGRERADVGGDFLGRAREAAAGAVAIGHGVVVEWRLVGDGEGGEVAALGLGHLLQRREV